MRRASPHQNYPPKITNHRVGTRGRFLAAHQLCSKAKKVVCRALMNVLFFLGCLHRSQTKSRALNYPWRGPLLLRNPSQMCLFTIMVQRKVHATTRVIKSPLEMVINLRKSQGNIRASAGKRFRMRATIPCGEENLFRFEYQVVVAEMSRESLP